MVNTLFASHLIDSKGRLDVDGPLRQTTEIKEQQHSKFTMIDRAWTIRSALTFDRLYLQTLVITENGVRLKLNIVDTPGYGDQVNNEGCWEPIVRYVSTIAS
jgi:septin family protein